MSTGDPPSAWSGRPPCGTRRAIDEFERWLRERVERYDREYAKVRWTGQPSVLLVKSDRAEARDILAKLLDLRDHYEG